MRFLSSAVLITRNCGIWGGSISTGQYLCGSIVVDVPLLPHYEVTPDTVLFDQYPKVFGHLGECLHYKVQGTVYRPSNNGAISPSPYRSIFGSVYRQEGVSDYVLTRTSTGAEYYVSIPDAYTFSSGMWTFGLAARRVGSKVYFAIGDADNSDSYSYRGGYTFRVYEYRIHDGKIESRDCAYYGARDLYRTHELRPFEAIDKFKNQLDAAIESESWFTWSGSESEINTTLPVDPASVQIPPWELVFPGTDRSVRWGDLAAEAYNSVPFFKSNGIAYGADLLSLKKDVHQSLELVKSFGTTGKYAAKAAQLFLSFYYGWRLLASDTAELQDALQRASKSRDTWNRATSRRTWTAHEAEYTAVLQCYYHRYRRASRADQIVLDLDLALTPENLWDLVPFSFVVDWFTGIGDILEDFSNYQTFVQKHEVVCTGRSIKAVKHVPAHKLAHGLAGYVTFSYYQREYVPYAVRPTFRFSNSVNPLDHLVEGSALIVSRR